MSATGVFMWTLGMCISVAARMPLCLRLACFCGPSDGVFSLRLRCRRVRDWRVFVAPRIVYLRCYYDVVVSATGVLVAPRIVYFRCYAYYEFKIKERVTYDLGQPK